MSTTKGINDEGRSVIEKGNKSRSFLSHSILFLLKYLNEDLSSYLPFSLFIPYSTHSFKSRVIFHFG